jgi:threonine dehydrogenase-like Zn-dependent dehydrogenase
MQDEPRIMPGENEVELAIEMAGICGSDVSGFLGHSPRRKPPLVFGHELVGRTHNGDRVVANPLVSCGRCYSCLSGHQNLCANWRLLGMDRIQGAFAEYVSIPPAQIYSIPDSLPSPQAALTEPLANLVHLFRITCPPPDFRLAIIGAGTMGTLALLYALKIGARDVLVADVSQQRLNTISGMGATSAINVSEPGGAEQAKEIAGWGFDVVLDASGSEPARQMAFDLCRPGGQVVLLGMAAQSSKVEFVTSIRKEHRVVMTFAYTPIDFERSLQLLVEGAIDLAPYTISYPLERGQEAFDLVTGDPGNVLKVLLTI